MSNASILSIIQHYQRSILKCQADEPRLLHCVSKLYKLPVEVEHLQETGIGKTVNALRKFDGEIGAAAKALVAKWKAMVASEEEPKETTCQQDAENNSANGGESDDDGDQFDQNQNKDKYSNDQNNSNSDTLKTNQSTPKDSQHSSLKNKNEGVEKVRSQHSLSKTHHKSDNENTREEASSSKHKVSQSSEIKHKHGHHSSHDRKDRQTESGKQRDHDGREHKSENTHKSSSSRHHKSNNVSKEPKASDEDPNLRKAKHREDGHRGQKESERNKNHNSHKERSKSAKNDKERETQKESKRKSTSKEGDQNERNDIKSSSAASKIKSPSISNSSASERKRRRDNSGPDSSTDSKSSPQAQPNIDKRTSSHKKHVKQEEEDWIDSSMGANFADVLGMLNVPAKKSKKAAAATKTCSVTSRSSSPATSAKSSRSRNESSSNTRNESSKSSKSAKLTSSYSEASCSRITDFKPDLLSSSAKLEPLDPNIVLALPTISTNYKPMPLNQTVMECVFPSLYPSPAPKVPAQSFTDSEVLHHSISSKTMRTKVYSGVRTGQLMQVPTLFDLCIRVLQKNIDALEYTGGVPFEVLRPVLERASPQQLLVFEEFNPYLMEDSDVLWQQHVQRHYRAQKRKEMESWREMFLRCQEDQDRKLNILAESIKQSQKIISAPIRKTQLAFIDSMVKPPRNVIRKQEQYGTKSKLIATPAARVAALANVAPNAAKTGDARLRVVSAVRDNAQVSSLVRPKKAPLMAKTLQFMRGRQKR